MIAERSLSFWEFYETGCGKRLVGKTLSWGSMSVILKESRCCWKDREVLDYFPE